MDMKDRPEGNPHLNGRKYRKLDMNSKEVVSNGYKEKMKSANRRMEDHEGLSNNHRDKYSPVNYFGFEDAINHEEACEIPRSSGSALSCEEENMFSQEEMIFQPSTPEMLKNNGSISMVDDSRMLPPSFNGSISLVDDSRMLPPSVNGSISMLDDSRMLPPSLRPPVTTEMSMPTGPTRWRSLSRNKAKPYTRTDQMTQGRQDAGTSPLMPRTMFSRTLQPRNDSANAYQIMSDATSPTLTPEMLSKSKVAPDACTGYKPYPTNTLIANCANIMRNVALPDARTSPALTNEMLVINRINYMRHPQESLHIPSKFGIDLKVVDLRKFFGITWLEDMIINFYLELIKARNNKEGSNLPKVYVFHAEILKVYFEHKCQYEGIIDETAEVGEIFGHDLIFFPIHTFEHWSLICVDLVERKTVVYDSLGRDLSDELQGISSYLLKEYRKLRKHNRRHRDQPINKDKSNKSVRAYFQKWSCSNDSNDTPQQGNCNDCGVFILQFAEYLSRRKPFNFTQANMKYFRQRMAYETLMGKLLNIPTPTPQEDNENQPNQKLHLLT